MSDSMVNYQLEQLVKAPMLAAIDAEISLHNKIQQFIMNYGFESEENEFNLKTIEIRYELNGKHMIMQVPALSLITLPLLTLKEASFDMDIHLINPRKKKGIKNKDSEYKLYARPMAGRINSLFPEKKVTGNLKVNLKLEEADMPSGLQELYGRLNQLFITKEQEEHGK